MRRTETYRTNKLRLLHKLLGMRNLARHYDGERSSSERLWYTGYYVYSNEKQVMNLFSKGKPFVVLYFQRTPIKYVLHTIPVALMLSHLLCFHLVTL